MTMPKELIELAVYPESTWNFAEGSQVALNPVYHLSRRGELQGAKMNSTLNPSVIESFIPITLHTMIFLFWSPLGYQNGYWFGIY